ncbi:phosphonate metabolism transcriptional regulator PhnF [Roseospirillum parvum]|uniref:GntR family transcriptional regulator, phosphonate transport system regulatory protein n=1 Tax=Roseospirillum parvum TaxID=83401 RepID=A0A1G8ETR7_9PROT|nr:phosphonate metabolism transcriptional regulator PhnF [Roseospirillum parvum]SDH73235.1 GntR family transcriptional regulator, phosphonate transport system regulatory protein [Roseospirillum parvum]
MVKPNVRSLARVAGGNSDLPGQSPEEVAAVLESLPDSTAFNRGRGAGVALWRQIQSALGQVISEGKVAPGQRLPTELELASRFGVNRHTVRRAMAGLEDEGLIRVEQGRGTFVHEPVLDYHVGARTRYSENLNRRGWRATREFRGWREIAADAALASGLELKVGAPVLHVNYVSHAEGRVISLGDIYFSRARFNGIQVVLEEVGSVTEALKRVGVPDYRRRTTRVFARMPSPGEADILSQPRNRPLLVTEGVDVDPTDRPVHVSVSRWASDWVQIVFDS